MSVAVSRKTWGARYGRGRKGRDLRNELVAHITVNRELPADASQDLEAAAMRAVERYVVQQRGFDGFPYSFCGFQSGRVYEGRGWGYDGAHTQQGRNSSAYALARYGHPDVSPSAAFFATARKLCAEGIARGFLTAAFLISGHRDYWQKGCPGDPYYEQREQLRPGPTTSTGEDDDVLERNDSGGEVTVLQWRINQLLHDGEANPRANGKDYGLTVDGVYGEDTERYVRHVQAGWGYRKHPGKATAAFLVRLDRMALSRSSG